VKFAEGAKNTTKGRNYMLYRYDALQRIVASQSATVNLSNGVLTTAANNAYSQKWTYDPNGNIRGHNDVTTPNSTRVGTTAGTFADNLTYAYSDSPTAIGGLGLANKTHNRLLKVTDLNTTQPTGQNGSNTLTYDNIGNLITNVSSISTEGTANIAWTVYGKVASITRLSKTTTYHYDERDNRLGEVNGHILLPPGNTRSREIERSGISCVVSVRLYRKRQRVNIKHEEPTILIAPTAKQTRHHAHSKCQ
jgi:hypothetical protein